MLVPVLISRLLIREMADSQFVTLQEADGSRRFPIAIGLTEAFAIERRLQNAAPLRPQTHDLLDAVIRELGATLERIEITDLQGGTFFARLVLDRDGERIEIDSRPSDALPSGPPTARRFWWRSRCSKRRRSRASPSRDRRVGN
jgi:bifunctional DNase/RNase